jgi:hypothetical protein
LFSSDTFLPSMILNHAFHNVLFNDSLLVSIESNAIPIPTTLA